MIFSLYIIVLFEYAYEADIPWSESFNWFWNAIVVNLDIFEQFISYDVPGSHQDDKYSQSQ